MADHQLTNDGERHLPHVPISLRIWFFLTGVVFPSLCIITAANFAFHAWPVGQTDSLAEYAACLLLGPGLVPFLPLILYSMASLTLWTIWPRCSLRFPIRLGIYAGSLLALQFFLCTVLATGPYSIFAAGVVAPCLAIAVTVVANVVSRVRRFTVANLFILTVICALISALLKYSVTIQDIALSPLIAVFAVLPATPTINLVTYVHATVLLCPDESAPAWPRRVVGWTAWLCAWAAAWAIASA